MGTLLEDLSKFMISPCRSFSVFYSKMINAAANYFFSKKYHQQLISETVQICSCPSIHSTH